MKRRKFLRGAGTGTIVLGSLPLLGGKVRAGGDDGENHKGFRFVVRSSGAGTNNLLLSGDGRVDPDEGGDIEGGGSFDQFTLTPPAPFPVVATGTWKARKFRRLRPGNRSSGQQPGGHARSLSGRSP
jgi:hypothetical protein